MKDDYDFKVAVVVLLVLILLSVWTISRRVGLIRDAVRTIQVK